MFSVRIHSLDDPGSAPFRSSSDLIDDCVGDPQEAAGTSRSTKPNPKVQLLRGIVHLYRTLSPPLSTSSSSSSTTPQVSSDSTLPPVRGTLILILAVPCHVSLEDLFQFCGSIDRSSIIQVIRNDAFEDRYSVLVKFDDQNSTDQFYLDANGWRFSAEGEVCHLLFINSVEFTDHTKIAGTPPIGSTELPTCPVCIERLDKDISGIIATTCDHSFQCSCISKWVNSSCSVCHFCRKHSDKPTCSICGTPENLWICVICGFVGCGRYEEGHAMRHWKDTQHCYTLGMETQRVWDYVGNKYVNRLNQSRSDNKLAKLNSNSRPSGKNCIHCGCSDDVGISEAILSSKVQMIVDKYNHLLASQLENQKQYYEAIVQKEKENKKYIADAVEKAVSLKLQDIQHKIHDVTKEKKVAVDINANLMKNQKLWQEKIKEIEERERTTLRIKDENIRDLQDQIRDYMVFIKAKDSGGCTKGPRGAMAPPSPRTKGTALPSPPPPNLADDGTLLSIDENLDPLSAGVKRVSRDPKSWRGARRVRSSWASKEEEEVEGDDFKAGGGEDATDDGLPEPTGSPSERNDRRTAGVRVRVSQSRDAGTDAAVDAPSDTDGGDWYDRDGHWRSGEDGRVAKVWSWLKGLGLSRYAPVFEIHEVDDEVLPLLTLDDLKDMGINAVGSRRKMFCSIQRLRKNMDS